MTNITAAAKKTDTCGKKKCAPASSKSAGKSGGKKKC